MRLYVPCSTPAVGGRAVLAVPAPPTVRIIAFKDPVSAIMAYDAVSRPWKLEVGELTLDMPEKDADMEPAAWETTIEELALSGFAGPSGFGVEVCEFVPPDRILVMDSYGVSVEQLDYDSVRSRLEEQASR